MMFQIALGVALFTAGLIVLSSGIIFFSVYFPKRLVVEQSRQLNQIHPATLLPEEISLIMEILYWNEYWLELSSTQFSSNLWKVWRNNRRLFQLRAFLQNPKAVENFSKYYTFVLQTVRDKLTQTFEEEGNTLIEELAQLKAVKQSLKQHTKEYIETGVILLPGDNYHRPSLENKTPIEVLDSFPPKITRVLFLFPKLTKELSYLPGSFVESLELEEVKRLMDAFDLKNNETGHIIVLQEDHIFPLTVSVGDVRSMSREEITPQMPTINAFINK